MLPRAIVSILLVVCVFVTDSYASDQSLLNHLVTMLKIPHDADARCPVPIKVYRLDLDVTGDGQPELFLGTTWSGSQSGMRWVVYTPQADGRYRPLGTIEFAYPSFYYSASASVILTPVHASAGAGPAFK